MYPRILIFFIFYNLLFSAHAENFTIANGDVNSLILSIQLANGNTEADTIVLANNGLYVLNSPFAGENGLPALTHNNNFQNANIPDLVFIGNGATIMRSETATTNFRATSLGDSLNLELHNLNFENFRLETDDRNIDGAVLKGGKLKKLKIFNCIFQSNEQRAFNNGVNFGGGVLTIFRTDSIEIRGSEFHDNTGNYGGALYITRSYVQIDSCLFHGNKNTLIPRGKEGGGAIRFHLFREEGGMIITNSIFEENITYLGGGAIIGIVDKNTSVKIENCTFRDNSAFNEGGENPGQGGAINLTMENEKNGIINNCNFHNNFASSRGGALYLKLKNSGSANVRSSTFHNNNTENRGGALYIESELGLGDTAKLENLTFAFNTALDPETGKGYAGAIYSEDVFNIKHSTIAYNLAGEYAGGILADKETVIKNCLLVSNKANNTDEIRQNAATSESLTGNISADLFVDGGNNFEYPPVNTTLPDNGYISTSSQENNEDPFLAKSLTYLCGNMPILALAPNSPAIDIDSSSIGLALDQLGNPRGNKRDIGAFEFQEGSAPSISIMQDLETTPILGIQGDDPILFFSEKDGQSLNPSYEWFLDEVPVGDGLDRLSESRMEPGAEVYVVMTPSITPSCPTHSPVESQHLFVQYNIAPDLNFGPIVSEEFKESDQEVISVSSDLLISELSLIREISLEYRGIAEDEWKTLSLGNNFSENIAVVDLQKDWFDKLGIEFRFYGSNVSGLTDTTDISRIYLKYTGDGMDFRSKADFTFGDEDINYSMISIPLELSSPNISSVLEDDLGSYSEVKWLRKWRLFRYDAASREYVEYKDGVGQIRPGESYFLIMEKESLLEGNLDSGEGTTTKVDKENLFSIPLTAGFNQVASPYPFDVSWDEIKAANPDIDLIRKPIFYNGSSGYSSLDYLPANTGVFIFMESDESLKIPVKDNAKKKTGNKRLSNSLDKEDWEVYFQLSDNKTGYQLGALGMRSDASEERDRYDIVAPPKFNTFLELTHAKGESDNLKLSKNVVPTAKEYSWDFEVNSSQVGELTTLSWENEYFGNSGMQLWLYDLDRQKIVDMGIHKSHAFFAAKGGNKFRVYYGSEKTLTKQIQPDRISLDIPQPHPVSGSSRIPFTLAEDSEVSEIQLKLFDLTGREIQVIFEDKLAPGFHEVNWDPSQTNIPSGTYILYLWVNQEPQAYQKIILQR